MIPIKPARSTIHLLLLCLLIGLPGLFACDQTRSDRRKQNKQSKQNEQSKQSKQKERLDQNTSKENIASPVRLPDFSSIKDVTKRKKRFFDFLYPLVRAENDKIRVQRQRLLTLHNTFQKTATLQTSETTWLQNLCVQYRISPDTLLVQSTFQRLLLRVDTIPAELALVQAAIESSWGRSRFAVQANNIFGQWCFKKGCGIVPARRSPGATHEIAIFPSPRHSVRAYIHNLNTYGPYRKLRLIRQNKRRAGERPDGHTLAAGLLQYSSTRADYVRKLRTILRQNKDLLPTPNNDLVLQIEQESPLKTNQQKRSR